MAVIVEAKGDWGGQVSDTWRPAIGDGADPDEATFEFVDNAALSLQILAKQAKQARARVLFRLRDLETGEASEDPPPVRD